MEAAKKQRPAVNILMRIGISTLVLAVGFAAMQGLASLKKPPAAARSEEKPLQVKTQRVRPEAVPVLITGYGEARALTTVSLASEVAGRVVYAYPRLDVGEIVAAGEVLLRIDERDYRAAAAEAAATVEQLESTIARLGKQEEIDRQRLKTLERTRELARAEFDRMRDLLESHRVGTRSQVDGAEQAYNAAADRVDQLAQALALYPIRIREARSSLAAANARRQQADIRLARCILTAPFRGRLKTVMVEENQYVSPGTPLLSLADDSVLEIRVPLDSRDARSWLQFDGRPVEVRSAWFSNLKPVTVRIRWSEDPADRLWTGRLNRVVKFDSSTRTLTVAVRIDAEGTASATPDRLPLVEGMFCAVEIPGRTLQDVFRLPRWAVSFENTVYTVVDRRLKTVPVRVARSQGEETLVSEGLTDGDIVIVTRLADPLENSLVEIVE